MRIWEEASPLITRCDVILDLVLNLTKRAFWILIITTTTIFLQTTNYQTIGARSGSRSVHGTKGEIGTGVASDAPISGTLSGLELGKWETVVVDHGTSLSNRSWNLIRKPCCRMTDSL